MYAAIGPLKPEGLHIPDGFLNLTVSLIFWLLSAGLIAIAIRRTQSQLEDRQLPLIGVMAAFIFAAQMINFPIVGGTSGHLVGGALAAITLGPWAGILAMTAVIFVQGLLFQDGGLMVMGANIFNMGVVSALVGYGLHQLGMGRGRRLRLSIAGVAAWLSVLASAFFTAIQLWLSGTSPLQIVVPTMIGLHALIGIGEAAITVAALIFLERVQPGPQTEGGRPQGRIAWALGGLITSLSVVLLSPLASSHPDGLERVAEELGFLHMGVPALFDIFPDYTFPTMGDTSASTVLAGAIGVFFVAGLVTLMINALRRPRA
jgi:cobalt/nickel transport system permease protein